MKKDLPHYLGEISIYYGVIVRGVFRNFSFQGGA